MKYSQLKISRHKYNIRPFSYIFFQRTAARPRHCRARIHPKRAALARRAPKAPPPAREASDPLVVPFSPVPCAATAAAKSASRESTAWE